MVKGMSIASFNDNSFHPIDTQPFSSPNENNKLKNLLVNAKKVLMFLSLTFFNIE